MAVPETPREGPYVVELKARAYSWCSCGRSGHQPFCDASHKGTPFRPVVFKVPVAGEKALCGCKRTGAAPYCDGSQPFCSGHAATA